VGRLARAIASKLKLRTDDSRDAVQRITGELADLAAAARNARRALRRAGDGASGRLRAAVRELETTLARTGRIVAQTRTRLSGETPEGATRLVSLHDPWNIHSASPSTATKSRRNQE
jgi:IS5 family transposase